MHITAKELWGVVHGLGFGSIFLLAFAGGFAGLYSLRRELLTEAGMRDRLTRLRWGTVTMAVVAWLTVISGTWKVYPWYRQPPPDGTEDLTDFPRYLLLANEATAKWHEFGMEWKEHVAWLAPLLATAVAFVVLRYGDRLADDRQLRRAVMAMFVLAFMAAAVAGLFGAFITKAAPVL
jgi:hypothetical protein